MYIYVIYLFKEEYGLTVLMYILSSRYESAAKELKNVLKVMVSSDSEKADSPRDDLSKVEMIMPKKITGILSKQSPFPPPDSNIPVLKVHFVVTEVQLITDL